MKKKRGWWGPSLTLGNVLTTQLFFDVGSSATRVVYQQKLVCHQPTCLSLHAPSQTVLEIGERAAKTQGKTPANIITVFPVRDGAVTHIPQMQGYLKALTQQALQQLEIPFSLSMTAVVSVPSSLSPVARQTWLRVFHESGFQRVRLVSKAQALYSHVQSEGETSPLTWIVDVGSQTTEIAAFSGSEVVSAHSLEFGGDHLTQALQELLQTEYQATLSMASTEQLKKHQRNLQLSEGEARSAHKTTVKASDMLSLQPRIVYLERYKVEAAFRETLQELLEGLRGFLSDISPEIRQQLLEQGCYLTGGSSQLSNIREYLQTELKTQVTLAKQPELDVIWGLAHLDHAKK